MKSKCQEVKIIGPNHQRQISFSDLESITNANGNPNYRSINHRHSKSLFENKSKMIDIGSLLNIEKQTAMPSFDNAKLNPNKFTRKSPPSNLKFFKKSKQKSERYISEKKKSIIA